MEICSKYQTPIDVVDYMIDMIPGGARTILEPSPGMGNIVEQLKKHPAGYDITAAEDFFTLEPDLYDCVIMNPPFSDKSAHLENAPEGVDLRGMRVCYYFLEECMNRSMNVIALVPWFTLIDSDVRMRNLLNYGLKSITTLPRGTFNYTRIQTCILELEGTYDGPTEFKLYRKPK